jgi:serine phosphatase RsbU (regulator of sigma subunit)
LLLRDGAVRVLELAPDLPLGLFADTQYRAQPFVLQRGDRLLMLTDGIDEAHHRGQDVFGLDRVADLLASHAAQPPAEFVRLLTKAVIDHRSGHLDDDASAVCLDWHLITVAPT